MWYAIGKRVGEHRRYPPRQLLNTPSIIDVDTVLEAYLVVASCRIACGLPLVDERRGANDTRASRRIEIPLQQISGLMFGDYYWFNQSHRDQVSPTDPTPIRELHGLWFRRLYFTYDYAYSERLSTRFRLEANSNGDFTGDDIVPYVKDAWLQWTYANKQQLTLGIQPSLTFDWLDEFWGLRHIEKSPADLYRLDSSRDFGFTFSGPTSIAGHRYAAQFGNESDSASETQEGKILRFERGSEDRRKF